MVGDRARVRRYRAGFLRRLQRAGCRREERHRDVDRQPIAACDRAECRRLAVGELWRSNTEHQLRLLGDVERHTVEEGQPQPQHGDHEEGVGTHQEGPQDHVQGDLGRRQRRPVGARDLEPERDRHDADRLFPAGAQVESRSAAIRIANDLRHRHSESRRRHRQAGSGRQGARSADRYAIHFFAAADGDLLQLDGDRSAFDLELRHACRRV